MIQIHVEDTESESGLQVISRILNLKSEWSQDRSSTSSILIKSGASLKQSNKDGLTPLHVAAKMGFAEVCVALVDHGANLEAADQEGNTPLILATKDCHSNTVSSQLSGSITTRMATLLMLQQNLAWMKYVQS